MVVCLSPAVAQTAGVLDKRGGGGLHMVKGALVRGHAVTSISR